MIKIHLTAQLVILQLVILNCFMLLSFFTDCRKTPAGASIARLCPFWSVNSFLGKRVAAPSWRATNGRPYILYIAKSMFFDMLFLLYLLCSKTQGSLRPSTYRFFPDFIFFFIIFLVFLLTLPYPHPIVMV